MNALRDFTLRTIVPDATGLYVLDEVGHAWSIEGYGKQGLEVTPSLNGYDLEPLEPLPNELHVGRFSRLVFRWPELSPSAPFATPIVVKVWHAARVAAVEHAPRRTRWHLLHSTNQVLGGGVIAAAGGRRTIFDSQDLEGLLGADPFANPARRGILELPFRWFSVHVGTNVEGKLHTYAHTAQGDPSTTTTRRVEWRTQALVATSATTIVGGGGLTAWAYHGGAMGFQDSTRQFMPYPPGGLLIELSNDHAGTSMQYEARVWACE